jgi:hypothetical protein
VTVDLPCFTLIVLINSVFTLISSLVGIPGSLVYMMSIAILHDRFPYFFSFSFFIWRHFDIPLKLVRSFLLWLDPFYDRRLGHHP